MMQSLEKYLGAALHDKLMEDIELLDIAGDEFDLENVRDRRINTSILWICIN